MKLIFLKRRYARSVGLVVALWAVMTFVDPFGLGDDADNYSYQFMERVMAPFHDFNAAPVQEDIVVVLMRDEDLELNDAQIAASGDARELVSRGGRPRRGWPIAYADHGAVLNTILAGGPRAVFSGVLIQGERSVDHSLEGMAIEIEDGLRRAAGMGGSAPPIFTGVKLCDDRTPSAVTAVMKPAIMNWYDRPERYQLLGALAPKVDCGSSGAAWRRDVDGGAPVSPALALYRAVCDRDPDFRGCDVGWSRRVGEQLNDGAAFTEDDRLARYMELRWLTSVPSAIRELTMDRYGTLERNCRIDEVSFLDRLRRSVINLILPIQPKVVSWLTGEVEEARQSCPPFLTLSVRHLELDEWRGMLKDKIVFYGIDVTDARDLYETPAHGMFPGIFLHALALENLFRYGENYAKEAPFFLGQLNSSDVAELFTLIFVMTLSTYLVTATVFRRGKRSRLWNILFLFVIAGAILIPVTVLNGVFDMPRASLVSLLSLILLAKIGSEGVPTREEAWVFFNICISFLVFVLSLFVTKVIDAPSRIGFIISTLIVVCYVSIVILIESIYIYVKPRIFWKNA